MSQPALAASAPAPFLRRAFDWWIAQVKHALPALRLFRRPVMTKTQAKRSITKASTSKVSATKTSNPPSDHIGLLVLGFDEQQKPCGARFVDAKPDLVAKAAQLMGLKVYKMPSPDVADVAKKLPVGQLYANGRAFVPNVRQSLYSDVIAALAAEPQQAAVGPDHDKTSTTVARAFPATWDNTPPGHPRVPPQSSPNRRGAALPPDRNNQNAR